jgi:hypothetical protein
VEKIPMLETSESFANNVDLWDSGLGQANINTPPGATTAIYELFLFGGGTYDLKGPNTAAGPAVELVFFPSAGNGIGPYIQN